MAPACGWVVKLIGSMVTEHAMQRRRVFGVRVRRRGQFPYCLFLLSSEAMSPDSPPSRIMEPNEAR